MRQWKLAVMGMAILCFDQAAKIFIYQRGLDIKGSFFSIKAISHEYAAFSLPISNLYILLASAGVLAWIVYLLHKRYVKGLEVPLVLIAAGGASNSIDRLVYGHAIDYIWTSFGHFNGADAAISIGALLIVAKALMSWQQSQTNIQQ